LLLIVPLDHRSLLLYISLFKIKIEEAKKAANPANTASGYIKDLKKTVQDRVDSTKTLLAQFTEEVSRLQAIASRDEFEQEKQFLTQQMQSMERIRQESRALTVKQEQQNTELRNQIQLLLEKIAALEKMVEHEKNRANRAEQIVALEERVRALGELLNETDITQFYNQHKDAVDVLKAKYKPRTSTVSGLPPGMVVAGGPVSSRRESISK
jgi:DNA-binding FrmR family transcriptional regulator